MIQCIVSVVVAREGDLQQEGGAEKSQGGSKISRMGRLRCLFRLDRREQEESSGSELCAEF